jgi:hypothetical protein
MFVSDSLCTIIGTSCWPTIPWPHEPSIPCLTLPVPPSPVSADATRLERLRGFTSHFNVVEVCLHLSYIIVICQLTAVHVVFYDRCHHLVCTPIA